jgi:hypothetical protein
MKPMIILPPDTMSEEHIKLLRDNELCVVVAKDPAKVKFVDPLPVVSSRTKIESAAIQLSRIVLNGTWGHWSTMGCIGRDTMAKIYVDLLMDGTPLDAAYTDPEVRNQEIYDLAKADELRKLARADAQTEHAAKKLAAKEAKSTPATK